MSSQETVTLIPRAQLVESPANVRKQFDKAKLDELAASIRSQGILEPLVVRPKGAAFEIVYGARRYRAAGLAQYGDLPCIVRQLTDAQVAQQQLVENLQREGISPLEEAAGYAELRRHLDVDGIAAQVGKGLRYVYQRLQLLRLQTSAKAALERGELSAGVAAEIARLPQDQQGAFVRSHSGWGRQLAGVTVAQAREWIQARTLALSGAPWKLEDAKLVKAAGACANCPKNSANEPAADKREQPRCMDPRCWGSKVRAHVDNLVAAYRRNGLHPVLLSEANAQEPPRQTAKCPGAGVPGIWKDGKRAGHVVLLCRNPKCKVHGGGRRVSAADKAVQTRQRAKMDATRRRNQQRLNWSIAVAAKAPLTPAKLGREDLRLIARALLEEEHHEARVAVCRMRGLEPAPGKRQTFDYFRAVARELQRATAPQQLLQLIYQLVLAPAVERSSYSGWAVKRLEPLAQRLRVRMPAPAPAKVKRAKKARKR